MRYVTQTVIFALALLLVVGAMPTHSQEDPVAALDWQVGPTTAQIGSNSTIDVPEGYAFLGRDGTDKLMVMMENIPEGNEYVLAPGTLAWYSIFSFNPIGYVKDDQKLDADDLLQTITEGTRQGNAARRERGWAAMTILGWRFPPRYSKQTNRLEWAILARQEDTKEKVVNYNTRFLGRMGVMEAVVVAGPEGIGSAVDEFNKVTQTFGFVSGERYAEYREGDKIAEYGLAALIVGGAAAVATKKGFWGVIAGFLAASWKFLAAAVAAAFGWIGSRFKKKA